MSDTAAVKPRSRSPLRWFGLGLLMILAVGLAAGYHIAGRRSPNREAPDQYRALRQTNAGYQFINPLLGCDFFAEKPYFKELEPLPERVAGTIAAAIVRGDAVTSSVYFRDLGRGQWLGYNENVKYFPASLLKVSLMISYFKLAETTPDLLNRQLTYNPAVDLNKLETLAPADQLVRGRRYSIDKLIEQMIVHSDNNALQLLMDNIDPGAVEHSFADLNISIPAGGNEVVELLSPKSYSIFLRILYNSTYLSREMSEKALYLLTRTEFTDGLGRGVPGAIKIAHKFGEYGNINPQTSQVSYSELHDCGIVYYPDHPYLLCIMTRGKDMHKLKRVIGDISDIFYAYFKEKYPPQ